MNYFEELKKFFEIPDELLGYVLNVVCEGKEESVENFIYMICKENEKSFNDFTLIVDYFNRDSKEFKNATQLHIEATKNKKYRDTYFKVTDSYHELFDEKNSKWNKYYKKHNISN